MDKQDLNNRRLKDRRSTMKLARITLDDGETIPCVIRDVSANGAKLSVARRHRLPESFHLSVDGRDEICRVRRVWQRGDEAGVTIDGVMSEFGGSVSRLGLPFL